MGQIWSPSYNFKARLARICCCQGSLVDSKKCLLKVVRRVQVHNLFTSISMSVGGIYPHY